MTASQSLNVEHRPLGVPLDDLEQALKPTNLNVSRDGDALIARHDGLATRVEVVPPANPESENGPIKAVIQITSELPTETAQIFCSPGTISVANSMATLGALTEKDGCFFVGSRLTVFEEDESTWNVQFPLLIHTVIAAPGSLLGGLRRTIAKEPPKGGESDWTESDLEMVELYLSRVSVCTTGGLSLTAEFGLKAGAVSAMAGHRQTALWQLYADQPHPELGGGLFCLLQLPHRIGDETKLDRVLNQLNQMEMEPHDLPPHFGAWCRGRVDNNPAYVAFLPNSLHSAHGIAANVSFWALSRARWANLMLASLGVSTCDAA